MTGRMFFDAVDEVRQFGHKSFLIPHLNLDTRAGRRHVWDAMTGQYFKQGGILKRVESGKSEIHK